MKQLNNQMKFRVEQDSGGVSKVVDESVDGSKAIPVVLVTKNDAGGFEYATAGGEGAEGPKGEQGEQGPQGLPGEKGEDGFPTQQQWQALLERVEALESAE